MDVALVYSRALDAYEFGPTHPLQAKRVSLSVALMVAYGVTGDGPLRTIEPHPASREELQLVHDPAYIETVMRASVTSGVFGPERGIGPGDTPAFRGMHDAASLVAGATRTALEAVTGGEYVRAFSPAGGLHHAHRDRAAGFCVYNDAAVAIASAITRDPSLRVLYLDIDAHHGDGVQEAFYEEPRVLTISLHESGYYLYPGTGDVDERGAGPGLGSSINVPFPPLATTECYLLAFDEVVVPATRAFRPDLIVAQCGADAHWTDPLTSLGLTLGGYKSLFERIVKLAEEACGGRLVACGGGGYAWARIVPRVWTLLAATLAGVDLPDELPEPWRAIIARYTDDPPVSLSEDPGPQTSSQTAVQLIDETASVIRELRTVGAI